MVTFFKGVEQPLDSICFVALKTVGLIGCSSNQLSNSWSRLLDEETQWLVYSGCYFLAKSVKIVGKTVVLKKALESVV